MMLLSLIKAFLVGGVICAAGQFLIDYTKLTPARILTGYVVAGVILSALGIYQPLADFAGAGATVPLTGFGHLLAEGVRKAVAEDGMIGILTGGMTAASAGITAALGMGLLTSLLRRKSPSA
jgi:stage V sporulation protein AE